MRAEAPSVGRSPEPLHDLELLLRSRYGLIVLDTPEEERAESLLRHLADRLGLPLFVWSRTKGLRRDGADGPVYDTAEPARALQHVESARFPALYHFQGLGPYLTGEPALLRRLKDAAAPYADVAGALVLTGPSIELPETFQGTSATLRLPAPDLEEYRRLLRHILRDLAQRGRIDVEIGPEETNRLLRNLSGLTLLEAEKVLTRTIVEDGRLSAEDVGRVVAAKRELVERDGLLEYYPLEESVAEVADLATLKAWLGKRRAILAEPERAAEFGLEFPKGVLLLGVPGCGKSLSAKAVAREWSLPLLRLDPSNLYDKYIGESERNFKRAIETAERMAPVVLWIDEIEKAFAGAADRDAGVTQRILGSFLAWLQERRGDVFVVATANDVERLPPEFLRKGRFDEVFFVDLPDAATRRRILEIHLERRGHDPARIDLAPLVERTDGFSGAEIEGVVVAGLYTAFSEGGRLTTDHLLREIASTRPLSVIRSERISALRAWAEGRTVRAH